MTKAGIPGHHRPDDARRAERSCVPRLLVRPGHAVLCHTAAPWAGGRGDAPHAARLHPHPRRRIAAPGRRRDPLWLNRMLLPDTVGTGGDSHTRFPIGISFPAGSGLVAFGAATGVMPLDMPESVRVRFKGRCSQASLCAPHANLSAQRIPYYAIKDPGAIKRGLTVEKQGKKTSSQAHPRDRGSGAPQVRAGVRALRRFRGEQRRRLHHRAGRGAHSRVPREQHRDAQVDDRPGYGDWRTTSVVSRAWRAWLGGAQAFESRPGRGIRSRHRHRHGQIKEPILCALNDPDDARLLFEVMGDKVDEVFIELHDQHRHFRAAGKLLKAHADGAAAHPALGRAAAHQDGRGAAHRRGLLRHLRRVGARTEMPGCSLCMGNQVRVAEKSTVVSTSTRNFPNRLGKGVDRVPGVRRARRGRLDHRRQACPRPEEYLEHAGQSLTPPPPTPTGTSTSTGFLTTSPPRRR